MRFRSNRGRVIILPLLACVSAESTLADIQHSPSTLKETLNRFSPYVATLSAAPVWISGNETQTFYLQPMTQKTYVADHHSNALAEGEFFFRRSALD